MPNDPADFARNSFDSQTLNSVLVSLRHDGMDILKIDSNHENIQSHELIHFLIVDGILNKVNELHVVIKLGKFENKGDSTNT